MILTGVRSRWIVAVSGMLMCVVALVPKIGAIVASTPSAALGGAGIAMFGVVVAAGVQTLAKVDFEGNRYNVLIVGFTIATALIPVMAPKVFAHMPDWTQPFLHNGVVLACLVSVLLNALLNGVPAAAPLNHTSTPTPRTAARWRASATDGLHAARGIAARRLANNNPTIRIRGDPTMSVPSSSLLIRNPIAVMSGRTGDAARLGRPTCASATAGSRRLRPISHRCPANA